MGMTIDEIKQELIKILAFAVSEKQYNAVKNALIIIDKYEKIEQMLEELDLQIDESAAYNLEVAKVQRLIRDRIDKLKEGKE